MPRSRPPTGLLLAALTACGGAGPTVPSGPRASILIAGDAVSDTIGATFSDSLDITVLGTGGVPVPKVDVNLSSAIDGFGRIQFLVPEPVSFATLRTDAAGRLRVKVRAAELAGSARFTVGVTSLRLLDTGAYTVLPGQPGGVRALLRDTALQVGRALTMRARTIDRFGNPRTDPVTFSSPDPGVAVAGARVTAGAIGRWRIASSSAGFSDTSLVSVVPSGLLAAGNAGGLYVFETDYTGFRKVAGVQTNFTAWTPNKPEVLTARVFSPELTAVGLDGGTRQLLSTSLGLSAVQPDGAFLYFAGAPSDDPLHQFRIWRARGDGSSPEPLPGIPEVAAGYAVPSPDGHTLIYAELLGSGTLHMYDLVAMAPLPFQRPGHSPSWSPDGRRIAYWQDGEIYLMDPDGSNTTALTAAGPAASVNLGFDWSGDGHWLVVTASASGRLTLIETSTGLALPLPPLDFGLEWPSWRH